MQPEILFIIFMFIAGLIIGSFLNVCIYRLPRKESLILPSSHCSSCGHPLTAKDLVPVLSFLFLKGRCRYCQEKIHSRYPLIELGTGLGFALIAYRFGFTMETAMNLVLLCGLIVCAMTDMKLQVIPLQAVIFLLAAGVILLGIQSLNLLRQGIFGFLAAGGVLIILGLLFPGKLGGGDIKLAAASGLYLGWENALLGLWLASVIALVVLAGKALVKKKTGRRIPFGPYLAAGALVAMICGNQWIGLLLGGSWLAKP